MPFQNMTPQQYAELQQAQPNQDQPATTLIDVREPWEFQIAHIDEAQLLPLGQIYEWAQTLDKNAPYVVMCHHGSRSAMACQVLQSLGFKQLSNLDGGIEAWSVLVESQRAALLIRPYFSGQISISLPSVILFTSNAATFGRRSTGPPSGSQARRPSGRSIGWCWLLCK